MYKNKLELNNYAKVRDDAIKMLNMIFHKILRVNLATDEFFEIKALFCCFHYKSLPFLLLGSGEVVLFAVCIGQQFL